MIWKPLSLLSLVLAGLLVSPIIAQETARKPVSAAKPRVASSGLCADLMLLLLADDDQIVSLSHQSTGPLSVYAEKAGRFPQSRGSAEEIIAAGTDVLLVDGTVDQRSALALRKFGVKIVDVPDGTTWDDIDKLTRFVAGEIGNPARGEAVLADMHRRLDRVRRDVSHGRRPTILYYRPDMGGAGEGSFVNTAIEAAGFRNLQVDWGPPLWGGVPVERVVYHPPDLFAVSYFDTNTQGLAVLRRNPVLWGAARTRPVLNVHGRYWNCASPALIEATEQLAAERRRLFGGRNR